MSIATFLQFPSRRIIDIAYESLLKGRAFTASHRFAAVADDGVVHLSITPGVKVLHIGCGVTYPGNGGLIFRRASVVSGGSAVPIFNKSDGHANPSLATILQGVTLDTPGELMTDLPIFGGVKNQALGETFSTQPGTIGGFKMAAGVTYTLSMLNQLGDVGDLHVEMAWIEAAF